MGGGGRGKEGHGGEGERGPWGGGWKEGIKDLYALHIGLELVHDLIIK